jgi:hypothetical protein
VQRLDERSYQRSVVWVLCVAENSISNSTFQKLRPITEPATTPPSTAAANSRPTSAKLA